MVRVGRCHFGAYLAFVARERVGGRVARGGGLVARLSARSMTMLFCFCVWMGCLSLFVRLVLFFVCVAVCLFVGLSVCICLVFNLFVRVPLFLAVCVSVVTCLIYLYHCRCVYLCMYLVMCKYFLCIFAFCTFFFVSALLCCILKCILIAFSF